MENRPQPGEKASALTTAMLETEGYERQQFGPRSPVRPECPHFAAEFALDPDRIPFMCASCRMRACDDCGAKWEVCHGCGGAICEGCTATGRSRRMVDTSGVRREYLCGPCANKQAAALGKFRATLANTFQSIDWSGDWLDVVVERMSNAIDEAREAL